MPARPWADKPRLDFLKSQLDEYEAAQERKKTRKFLSHLHNIYLEKFPQPNEKLLSVEMKRVSTWMNNHSGGRGRRNGGLMRATRVTFRELLAGRLAERKRQKLQLTQAYSQMYYKIKWKTTVETEWAAKLKDEPDLSAKDFLAYRNMRVKQFFNAEPDDVKADVELYRNTRHTGHDESSNLLLAEEGLHKNEQARRISGRNVQTAIENVEAIMTEIARDLEDITGLKSHIMIGGPEPKRNGRMVMFTISAGKTVSGNRTFKEHHPTYRTDVKDSFFSFIKGCYTAEEREKYAHIPFHDGGKPPAEEGIRPDTPSGTKTSVKASRKSAAKVGTAPADAALESDSDSVGDDDSDNDSDGPAASDEDAAVNSSNDDEDEDDIFSKHLPADRRIVDSKEDASGLKLHKTANGKWLSEAELQRMANIERNIRIMKSLGLEEASRSLATRAGNQGDKEPDVGDDQDFSTVRTQELLPQRDSHPRRSKRNVTYVEGKGDGLETMDSISVARGPGLSGNSIKPVLVSEAVDSNVMATESSLHVPPVSSVPDPTSTTDLPGQVLPATLVESSIRNEDSMDIDNLAELALPMELDNHASLDGAAAAIVSSVNSSQSSVQPMDLDTMDLSKVPMWLQLPLKYLRSNFRGEMEEKVLSAFVALEMAWQPFEKRISTDGRPPAVAWWLKNARPIDRVPPCIDLASFPDQVRAWWTMIQPQWCTPVVGDWPLSRDIPVGEYWHETRLGGCNGLFVFVMCLYWWRRSAEEELDKVALTEFESAAEDVAFVFEAILSSGVSQASCTPLSGSARANARPSASRKASLPDQTAGRLRALRSSGSNVGPRRTRRSRA